MRISIARKIAYGVLLRVEAEGAYASDLLHSELGAQVKPADAALATEITMGVLRWRRFLDLLLDPLLKKPVAQLDLPVAIALRMGLYQLRYLQRVPSSAAVNESVELVKMARKASAATLVNAVLRRAVAVPAGNAVLHGAAAAKTPAKMLRIIRSFPADQLAILHSHPTWMVERWLARFGEARTISLLEANNRPPRLSLALHDADRRAEVIEHLRKSGLRVENGQLLNSAIAVSGGSPARSTAFQSGAISIQDEASQAIPLLLDVCAGDRVLDLCAAPGGKTPALVRAASRQGTVIAADVHSHRLAAMHAQFQRLQIGGVSLVELDAAYELPFREKFDRILVDAPCSGTGTLSRHPEIRWRLQPEQLAEFHRLQVPILVNAIAQLAPRGRLVYSTCSLEPEENEDVVVEALELSAPLSIQRVTPDSAAKTLEPYLAPNIDSSALFDEQDNSAQCPVNTA